MRAYVQILGGVVLGLGPASAVGLDPSALFAIYTIGLSLTLLGVSWLMVDEPGAGPAQAPDGPRPPHR